MNTYLRIVSLAVVSALIGGCVLFSSPPDNADFGDIQTIHDLEGTWRNRGEHGSMSSGTFLSMIIWPTTNINHKDIQTIEVRATSEHELLVRALRSDGVEKESVFAEGKDFDLKNGRILLKRNAGVAGAKAGEPIVGPYYHSTELGLDKNGQGKYQENFAVVGLAYLFLPVAMSGSDDIRFIRLSKP